jgi:aspartate/methionine/tyrosine aminotransferase
MSASVKTPVRLANVAAGRPRFRSDRTTQFTESVIREMTRLAMEHNAVNLAQGYPDFEAPAEIKRAAQEAIAADFNQYAITWGAKPFRDAIQQKYKKWYRLDYDPEREITVCCGATEGMIASLLAVTNPGDEIIIFEPYYENYGPDALLCDANRKLVRLHPPDWNFDPDELRRAFSSKTKAIILNSPNNPTGKVFTRLELELIANLCQEFDTLAITDEIYEHILYDGASHVPIATLPGMRERTVLVNSMSKTYSVTGWRVGFVLAAPDLTDSIRKVHDFLTVGAAAPLQQAGVVALNLPDSYYEKLSLEYQKRRDLLLDRLAHAGFRCYRPSGAYYVISDISEFGFPDDLSFARHMIESVGVAVVPGSSFFSNSDRSISNPGSTLIRFCFCKKYETLKEAGDRLRRVQSYPVGKPAR